MRSLSGREARRSNHFGQARRKGAGWTRPFREGREQRRPFTDDEKLARGMITPAKFVERNLVLPPDEVET